MSNNINKIAINNAKQIAQAITDNRDVAMAANLLASHFAFLNQTAELKAAKHQLIDLLVEYGNTDYAMSLIKLVTNNHSVSVSTLTGDNKAVFVKLRQMIIDSNDPECALTYYQSVDKDVEVRQIIVDANNPRLAVEYCKRIAVESDMRKIVLDSNDPQSAYDFCKHFGVDADMRQLLLNANNPHYAIKYLVDVNFDDDMRQIVADSNIKPLLDHIDTVESSNDLFDLALDGDDADLAYQYLCPTTL